MYASNKRFPLCPYRARGLFLATLLLASLPSVAEAERPCPAPWPFHAVEDAGTAGPSRLVLEASLGAGRMDTPCDRCDLLGVTSAAIGLGYRVRPRWVVMADVWGVLHRQPAARGFLAHGHGVLSAAARYEPTDRLWLQAGMGRASGRVSLCDGLTSCYEEHRASTGYAWVAAAGFELHRVRALAVDVQIRVAAPLPVGATESAVRVAALGLGVSWR